MSFKACSSSSISALTAFLSKGTSGFERQGWSQLQQNTLQLPVVQHCQGWTKDPSPHWAFMPWEYMLPLFSRVLNSRVILKLTDVKTQLQQMASEETMKTTARVISMRKLFIVFIVSYYDPRRQLKMETKTWDKDETGYRAGKCDVSCCLEIRLIQQHYFINILVILYYSQDRQTRIDVALAITLADHCHFL